MIPGRHTDSEEFSSHLGVNWATRRCDFRKIYRLSRQDIILMLTTSLGSTGVSIIRMYPYLGLA